MPRFDNEGFNPQQRINNDTRDRSVPEDENYYGFDPNDINFDMFSSSPVRDKQTPSQNTYDPSQYKDAYSQGYGNRDDLAPPVRSQRQNQNGYRAEVARDYDAERRSRNVRQASNRPKQRVKKPPKKLNFGTGKRILTAVCSLFLVLVIAFVGLANLALGRINYDEAKDNPYVTAGDVKSSPFVKNILLLGVDARSGEESEASRADSMMLVSIDMKHHCIKMVSFLRDTWVYIPAHDGKQRLNAACTYGGYSGVCDTIEYNFGVKIDGYVVADFEMFKVLVDSIGGVEVEVTEKEAKEVTKHKKRYGNVKLEAGKYKLTGEQALAYCRIRKIDTDFMRAKRQRTVMQSILKGVKKANVFTLYKMAYKSAPYIETDLSKGKLIKIAMQAMTCLTGDMVETRVPFDGTWEYANINGASVISIDPDKNKELLRDYIYKKSADEIQAEEAAKENK